MSGRLNGPGPPGARAYPRAYEVCASRSNRLRVGTLKFNDFLRRTQRLGVKYGMTLISARCQFYYLVMIALKLSSDVWPTRAEGVNN